MNRGRHKKSKEKEFNTQAEILDTIQKKLRILLSIYKDQSTCSTKDFYAKAWISSNDGRDYYGIAAWYINNVYYINNFISRVKVALGEATIKNKIYLIKFGFGRNTTIFRYKHE
jgi:hypothetical protein